MIARKFTSNLIFIGVLTFFSSAGSAADTTASNLVQVTGELKRWHRVSLTFSGPTAQETDQNPNPFADFALQVTFQQRATGKSFVVPGFFAADGNAAETSARQGNQWRVHFASEQAGVWTYRVSFVRGPRVAIEDSAVREPVAPIDGLTGQIEIGATDKQDIDLRGKGRLEYVNSRYLRFAGNGEYFLKTGADAPENLLAFADFDGTWSRRQGSQPRAGEAMSVGLHRYEPHLVDWHIGDPVWQGEKGKGLVGALNYLAGAGANSFSFLTYNVGGDGDDVWPYTEPTDKWHFDVSKLDQWQIIFDHAQRLGMYHHFKLQETENDDNFLNDQHVEVSASLDGGDLGPTRKLYLREMIARFGYLLALNWNLGEENTQTPVQQKAMARFIYDTDPYHHPIVVHTYPGWQERVYSALIGQQSVLTGASLQNSWDATHERTVHWIEESTKAGRPWVVANDEQNPPDFGVPPDPGYASATRSASSCGYDLNDIRKMTLWGNLMAGGAGVEYYFGYRLVENDLNCEDWRSRDQSWRYGRIAREFFQRYQVPFWEMKNADHLVENLDHGNSKFCLAKTGEIYVVYLPKGGSADLDLEQSSEGFWIDWFDPRAGGALQTGSIGKISGPGRPSIGSPPNTPEQDWVALVRRAR